MKENPLIVFLRKSQTQIMLLLVGLIFCELRITIINKQQGIGQIELLSCLKLFKFPSICYTILDSNLLVVYFVDYLERSDLVDTLYRQQGQPAPVLGSIKVLTGRQAGNTIQINKAITKIGRE